MSGPLFVDLVTFKGTLRVPCLDSERSRRDSVLSGVSFLLGLREDLSATSQVV